MLARGQPQEKIIKKKKRKPVKSFLPIAEKTKKKGKKVATQHPYNWMGRDGLG